LLQLQQPPQRSQHPPIRQLLSTPLLPLLLPVRLCLLLLLLLRRRPRWPAAALLPQLRQLLLLLP
jgi:hypothetical protein